MPLLREVFKRLGLPGFGGEVLHQIKQEDRGTSLRLLYQIKKSIEPVKDDAKTEKIPRLPRPELDPSDVYWYKMGGHKEPLLKPFLDEERRQVLYGEYLDDVDEHTMIDNIARNRDELLEQALDRRNFAAEQEEHVLQFWRGTYRADVAKTTEEVRVEREVLAREQAKIDSTRKYYRKQALDGIDSYERNLQRIGIDTSENAGTDVPTRGINNPMELLESMKKRLPSRKNLFLECLVHMRKIKAGGRTRRKAALEREKRRRKQRVQASVEAADLAKTTALKEATATLTAEMHAQQVAARAHYLQDIYEQKLFDERAAAQTAFAQRRNSESEARWRKQTATCREHFDSVEKPARTQRKEVFKSAEAERQQQRQEKHSVYCNRVLEDLLDVADDIFRKRYAQYQADGELPPRNM
ncbi:unnamed protein product, partial [Amoebophrya sp. A25]|eukprot:GSA25T00017413001.1